MQNLKKLLAFIIVVCIPTIFFWGLVDTNPIVVVISTIWASGMTYALYHAWFKKK